MKQKKQSGGWILLILGILMLAGAVFTAVTNAELIFNQNVSNINKLLEQGSLKSNVDSYIEIKIDAVIDNFLETTHQTNGITTGKDQHYIVWLDDDSFIAVSVKNKKLISELDRIMYETWDYLDEKSDELTQDTLLVKGKIKKMSSEMRKYYDDRLDNYGINAAGYEIHYFQIDCTTSRTAAMITAALLLVLGIILIIAFIATRKKLNNAAVSGFDVPQGGYSSYDYSYGTGSGQNFEAPETIPEAEAVVTEIADAGAAAAEIPEAAVSEFAEAAGEAGQIAGDAAEQ